jgi:hypothetical protein
VDQRLERSDPVVPSGFTDGISVGDLDMSFASVPMVPAGKRLVSETDGIGAFDIRTFWDEHPDVPTPISATSTAMTQRTERSSIGLSGG